MINYLLHSRHIESITLYQSDCSIRFSDTKILYTIISNRFFCLIVAQIFLTHFSVFDDKNRQRERPLGKREYLVLGLSTRNDEGSRDSPLKLMKARHEWKHGSRGIHILELACTPLKFPCLSFGSSMLRTCLANAYFTTYHALLNSTACFRKHTAFFVKENITIISNKKNIIRYKLNIRKILFF